ncbi:MAG: DUF1638 domain-containing protein [Acidobacteria bacterium]|nr:DUF1638 domain-containing protein [Acidobacteriota bacterium]
MSGESRPLVCVACSIFRDEMERLQAQEQTDLPVRFLGSMLHMVPERLEQRLKAAVQEELAKGHDVLLAYGDCCPHMVDIEEGDGVGRTGGINCCEILLGREAYRRLRREGVFFLMPEWTLNWKAVFRDTLGLHDENARHFMRDMHTRLVYLDTGLIRVPEEELTEIAQFTGLPVERMQVSLDPLLASLRDAAERILGHE